MTNDEVTGLAIAIVMVFPLAAKAVYREASVKNVQNGTLINFASRSEEDWLDPEIHERKN